MFALWCRPDDVCAMVLQNLENWRYTQPAIALEYIWHIMFGEHWAVTEPIREIMYPHPSASPTPAPEASAATSDGGDAVSSTVDGADAATDGATGADAAARSGDTATHSAAGPTSARRTSIIPEGDDFPLGTVFSPANATSLVPESADVINGTILVVARNHQKGGQGLEWLTRQPYPYVPMTYDKPAGTLNNVPFTRGREAAAYIQFILDNWHALPPRMIFIHDHESSWHVDQHFKVSVALSSFCLGVWGVWGVWQQCGRDFDDCMLSRCHRRYRQR